MNEIKAFDRVHHGKLFKLLVDRKVPGTIMRCLLVMYWVRSTITVWKGKIYEHVPYTLDCLMLCKHGI